MLAEAGYDVVLTARREQPLKAAAAAIGARYVAADSTDVDSFATVIAQTPRVDLLIHAAGVLEGTFVRKESVDSFDAVIRANLRSAFVVSSAVLPVMPERGRIIF